MIKRILSVLLLFITLSPITAQTLDPSDAARIEKKLRNYLDDYKPQDTRLEKQPKLVRYTIDDSLRIITVYTDEIFAQQEFSPKIVAKIYKKISKLMPEPYEAYNVNVITHGMSIEELIPNQLAEKVDETRMWGDIDYHGEPWVKNISRPYSITNGLQNRHLTVWPSHGRYYDAQKRSWKWQRPNLFATTEDLFTQTIVVPYLIPMLERAGAVVFMPRERDWQRNEVIVDNDDSSSSTSSYEETTNGKMWLTTNIDGFAFHDGTYYDGENPFTAGTARMVSTASNKHNLCQAIYTPDIPKTGDYAVYISYQTVANSIDDAEYTVVHQGTETVFHVNQTMGGGTWVYLGTFHFDEGKSAQNRIILSNISKHDGVVTTDAVRIGGGMGNITRGGTTSGLPRCLEGARYYAQWAGAPYSVVSINGGSNDYKDDIQCRSLMSNWLAGGSCFMPNQYGKNVPIELSLAIHSDAGVSPIDGIYGTLAICTTNNDGKTTLDAGISRMASRDFADQLLSGIYRDMNLQYNNWTRRSLWDRNYSETRRPNVPSAILETLSHQNFTDMRYAHDPNFRFQFARSIYKSILRYICFQHKQECVIEPLQPNNFRIDRAGKEEITLRWNAVNDPYESSAKPTSYVVYTAIGNGGFDNGVKTNSTDYNIRLTPGQLYRFRVTACNRGGESFPSEELSAVYEPATKKKILIVNGFHRLSSPAVIDTDRKKGFDLDADPGITYGKMAGWSGYQQNFDSSKAGREGVGALGYCGNELAGTIIAGNDFNYVTTHASAINSAHLYNIVSCSSEAVENGSINMKDFDCVDLVLGLEKDDGHSLVSYKSFSPLMQQKLSDYLKSNGRLLVSGSYIGSDMTEPEEMLFLEKKLKLRHAGNEHNNSDNTISGLGQTFGIYRTLNEEHYAATSPDILQAVEPAYCAMKYSDGMDAGVAYAGKDYRTFTMGFPFECIIDANIREIIMRGIIAFLMK